MSLAPYRTLPPPPPPASDPRTATASAGPLARALDALLLGIVGRAWLGLWLRLYPQARPVLAWTYHEEMAAAPPARRWRRGLSFFAGLPRTAAAQAQAESNDATHTGGDPPEPPPWPNAGSSELPRLLSLAASLVAGVFFAFFAVVTWFAVAGEMGNILGRTRPTSGDEIAALGLMALVASAPVLAILYRRRFVWRRPADTGESTPQLIGWAAALVAFGALAFIIWLGVVVENIDRLGGRSVHAFDNTLGLAIMPIVAALPLAALVRRRHWLERRPSEDRAV